MTYNALTVKQLRQLLKERGLSRIVTKQHRKKHLISILQTGRDPLKVSVEVRG